MTGAKHGWNTWGNGSVGAYCCGMCKELTRHGTNQAGNWNQLPSGNATTDASCKTICVAHRDCVAWVNQPSGTGCWISSTVPTSTKPAPGRTYGTVCRGAKNKTLVGPRFTVSFVDVATRKKQVVYSSPALSGHEHCQQGTGTGSGSGSGSIDCYSDSLLVNATASLKTTGVFAQVDFINNDKNVYLSADDMGLSFCTDTASIGMDLSLNLALDLRAQDYTGGTRWPARVGPHATLHGKPAFDSDGIHFQRSGQWASISLNTDGHDMPSVSYSIWLKLPAKIDAGLGWAMAQYPDHGWSRAITLNDGRLNRNHGVSVSVGRAWDSTLPKPPVGEWFHVVGTWKQGSGSDEACIYMDGTKGQCTGASNSMHASVREDLIIGGKGPYDTRHNPSVFVGDVRVYSTALTQSQANQLFAEGQSKIRTCGGCANGGLAVKCKSNNPSWNIDTNKKNGWMVMSSSRAGIPEPDAGGKAWYTDGYTPGQGFMVPSFGGSSWAEKVVGAQGMCGADPRDDHWHFRFSPSKARSDCRLEYLSTPRTFDEAEAECIRLGGHLASLHSVEDVAHALSLAGQDESWIGLTKQRGAWAWTDGTLLGTDVLRAPMERELWATGQGTDNLCGHWTHRRGFKASWDDVACSQRKPATCRICGGAYKAVITETEECASVHSLEECEKAAHAMRLGDTTATIDTQAAASDPPYCYFEGGSLKFNAAASNTGTCTSFDMCLCRVEVDTPMAGSCAFELSMCGWSAGKTTGGSSWQITGGLPRSNFTGALQAHRGKRYAVFDTSVKRAGTIGYLGSPQLSQTHRSVSWYYHMYGEGMGTLALEALSGGWWTTVWSISGQQQTNQDGGWRASGKVMLPTGTKQVRFKGVQGATDTGDMSVDTVAFSTSGAIPDEPVLLFAARGDDRQYTNRWGGWYSPNSAHTVHSGYGKYPTYNTHAIDSLKFEDARGRFVEFVLAPRYRWKTLLSVIVGCMGEERSKHSTEPTWQNGHCTIGVRKDHYMMSSADKLRIGVGDNTTNAQGWALFVPDVNQLGPKTWALGVESRLNHGFDGDCKIWATGTQRVIVDTVGPKADSVLLIELGSVDGSLNSTMRITTKPKSATRLQFQTLKRKSDVPCEDGRRLLFKATRSAVTCSELLNAPTVQCNHRASLVVHDVAFGTDTSFGTDTRPGQDGSLAHVTYSHICPITCDFCPYWTATNGSECLKIQRVTTARKSRDDASVSSGSWADSGMQTSVVNSPPQTATRYLHGCYDPHSTKTCSSKAYTAEGSYNDSYISSWAVAHTGFCTTVTSWATGVILHDHVGNPTFVNAGLFRLVVNHGDYAFLNVTFANLGNIKHTPYGGAVTVNTGSQLFTAGSFHQNSAESGGAVCVKGRATVAIAQTSLSGNTATKGGAIYLDTSTLRISRSTFFRNEAVEHGGSIYVVASVLNVANVVFSGGGALFNPATSNMSQSGAVFEPVTTLSRRQLRAVNPASYGSGSGSGSGSWAASGSDSGPVPTSKPTASPTTAPTASPTSAPTMDDQTSWTKHTSKSCVVAAKGTAYASLLEAQDACSNSPACTGLNDQNCRAGARGNTTFTLCTSQSLTSSAGSCAFDKPQAPSYSSKKEGGCAKRISSVFECQKAAEQTLYYDGGVKQVELSSVTPGCFVSTSATGAVLALIFNSNSSSKTPCSISTVCLCAPEHAERVWGKNARTSCARSGYVRSQGAVVSFASLSAAEVACSADNSCAGIVDNGCDGRATNAKIDGLDSSDYHLCTALDDSSIVYPGNPHAASSCVFTRPGVSNTCGVFGMAGQACTPRADKPRFSPRSWEGLSAWQCQRKCASFQVAGCCESSSLGRCRWLAAGTSTAVFQGTSSTAKCGRYRTFHAGTCSSHGMVSPATRAQCRGAASSMIGASIEPQAAASVGNGTWKRYYKRHCYYNSYKGKYSTASEAVAACQKLGAACSGVWDRQCDGKGDFWLCKRSDNERTRYPNCVYRHKAATGAPPHTHSLSQYCSHAAAPTLCSVVRVVGLLRNPNMPILQTAGAHAIVSSCTASASRSGWGCEKVYDGFPGRTIWQPTATGARSWIQLNFARKSKLSSMRFAAASQRSATGTRLELQFSSGQSWFVKLINLWTKLGDNTDFEHIYAFHAIETTYVKVVVAEVSGNHFEGVEEIQFGLAAPGAQPVARILRTHARLTYSTHVRSILRTHIRTPSHARRVTVHSH